MDRESAWRRRNKQSLRACENSVQIGMSGGKVRPLARGVVLNIDEDNLLGESKLWRPAPVGIRRAFQLTASISF